MQQQTAPMIVVAGHVCLDLIPQFEAGGAPRLEPGTLVRVGPALRSTGGAVSNTGLALHRLGTPVRLMGKIGDDFFGEEVLRLLRQEGEHLAEGMIVAPGEPTSYSVVISPPGVDRLFLHCPGANDTFTAEDLDPARLAGARLLHFGYPPIMRRMYLHAGRELAALLERARAAGVATSLDTSSVDPASEAGRADWPGLLANVLPHVDLFLPSLDEVLFMLGQPAPPTDHDPDPAELARVAERLLDLGAAVVALKLGAHGLYLRTSPDPARIQRIAGSLLDPDQWTARELYAPCFDVEAVGTTGSGDCTIAGLLAAVVQGTATGPGQAMEAATAVGAFSVESPDACGGVRPWEEVRRRIETGWSRREPSVSGKGWRPGGPGLWSGPHDASPAVPAHSLPDLTA